MSDEKSISGENERKNVESVRREGERGGGLVTLEMGRQRILHGPSLRVSDPHGRLRPAVGEYVMERRDFSVQSGTDLHMTNRPRWEKARLTSEILARPDDRFDKPRGQGSVCDIVQTSLCTA